MRHLNARSWPLMTLPIVAACLVPYARGSGDMPSAPPEFRNAESRTREVARRLIDATIELSDMKGGAGSGVLVSEDGLILTAAHVLATAGPGAEWEAILPDGRRAKAKALGWDSGSDAGMARIVGGGKWPFVERGRSADLKIGDWCLATGHPGKSPAGGVPRLRLGRVLAKGDGKTMISGLVTDATIALGDSGGPLYSLDGKLVGIHSSHGLTIEDNRHVPIDAFTSRWDNLLRGQVAKAPAAKQFPAQIGGSGEIAELMTKYGKPQPDGSMRLEVPEEKTEEVMAVLAKNGAVGLPGGGGANPGAGDPKKGPAAKQGPPATVQGPVQVGGSGEVAELMAKYGKPGPDGSMQLEIPEEKTEEVMAVLAKNGVLGMPGGGGANVSMGDQKSGKAARALLSRLEGVTAAASRGVAVVRRDGEPVGLGMVVRKDGYIVTKAGELDGKLTCDVGGREYAAELVGRDDGLDLTLLRVGADDLVPVAWAEVEGPPLGTWLVTPGGAGKAIALSVVGHAAREILQPPAGRVSVVLGTLMNGNGQLSSRKDGFASAFAHDGVLKAAQCGGPVLDLDGRAIGLNIARADRVTTYATPAAVVKKFVAAAIADAKKAKADPSPSKQ